EFDRLGVFAYSQEDDTTAYPLGDPIASEVKMDRIERVMELQRSISARKNDALIGKTERVFVESVEGEEYVCRTYRDAPEVDGQAYVTSSHPLQAGDFV